MAAGRFWSSIIYLSSSNLKKKTSMFYHANSVAMILAILQWSKLSRIATDIGTSVLVNKTPIVHSSAADGAFG